MNFEEAYGLVGAVLMAAVGVWILMTPEFQLRRQKKAIQKLASGMPRLYGRAMGWSDRRIKRDNILIGLAFILIGVLGLILTLD